MTRGELFVQAALGQVGTTEDPPGSNMNPYAPAVGDANGFAWCCTFVHWCANEAGLTFPSTAYVPTLEAWARSNGYVVPADQIRRGDVVCLDFTQPWGDGSDHVEIATGPVEAGTVPCVGGNTSDTSGGSIDNGGGVYTNVRPVAWVATAIRLPGSDDIIDDDQEEPMLVTWSIPDGTLYILDTRTGISKTAQDAFPQGSSTADILSGIAELKAAGLLKDAGSLGWGSNWVVRTAQGWQP